MIDAITKYIKAKYNDKNEPEWTVVILAPTGIAAFNVNGVTIHRFFKLPVFKEKKNDQLSDQALKIIRMFVHNLKLIIIGNLQRLFYLTSIIILKIIYLNIKDEISMVSNVRLAQIHLRLNEIFTKKNKRINTFGGQNLLFFGDLLQVNKFTYILSRI